MENDRELERAFIAEELSENLEDEQSEVEEARKKEKEVEKDLEEIKDLDLGK